MSKMMLKTFIAAIFIAVFMSFTVQLYAENYPAEFATLTGSCWTVDVWNIPMAGNRNNNPDYSGNMKFYNCGDTIAPLYQSAFILGWMDEGVKKVYSNAIAADSTQYHFLARGQIEVDSAGQPSLELGYLYATGSWCTADSAIFGTVTYIVPASADTAVLIEHIALWNESGVPISDLIVGQDIDWNCNRETAYDLSKLMYEQSTVCQYGASELDDSVIAGMVTSTVQDNSLGAITINSYDYTAAADGYYPEDVYDLLNSMDYSLDMFSDSANGTDLHTLTNLMRTYLSTTDTIYISTIKAISLNGYDDLYAALQRGESFIFTNHLCEPWIIGCGGTCGDANNDTRINVSDAVHLVNYVFNGGNPPVALLSCGDASGDGRVNVSDAVYIINYVFSGGNPPGDCTPGSIEWRGHRCCPF